jgi:serpin B
MRYGIIGLLAVTLVASAAGQDQSVPGPLSADAKAVVQGNNLFACDLYAQLRQEPDNLFFSPYSISTALAMTYAGARGNTAAEMAATMHFDLPPEKLHPGFGELIKHLNAPGKDRPYQLTVANRLWGQQGYNFLPEFLKLTEDQYRAGLKEVNFAGATEAARQEINAWVEKQTQDKIKELLKKGVLNVNTRLVLTNAIYFKAPWAVPFEEAATKPGDFTLASGDKAQVPMMHKAEKKLLYLKGKDFTAVQIPYKGHELAMVVLLPNTADGLAAVEKSVSAAQLNTWLKQMTLHKVDLKLPKFKVTSEFSLKTVLSDMGMKSAFDPKAADFSGMTSPTKLFISAVIHKAFVDVNEKDTEAAAATAVVMQGKSEPPEYPHATFHVNRPFLFLLKEQQTGSILFVGRVTDPTK